MFAQHWKTLAIATPKASLTHSPLLPPLERLEMVGNFPFLQKDSGKDISLILLSYLIRNLCEIMTLRATAAIL